jgi:Mce-associated membrane protein
VEDQQPASGDLTESETEAETPVEEAAATDEAAPEEATAAEENAATDEVAAEESPAPEEATAAEEAAATDEVAAEESAAPEESAPAAEPKSRSRTRTAIIAAAATFVVACALAAAAVEPYVVSRAAVVTKLTIATTAAEAINTLWTYTPDDMDALPDRAAKYLSGDFEDQYRKFVDAIAATNKQAQVSNSTEVVAAAVESVSGDEATALVYTNSLSSTPQAPLPSMKYVSYRLNLKREGTRWLVTKMTTVTSLDLTPKL